VTTREALPELVNHLPDEQAEVARTWLEDLRCASDEEDCRSMPAPSHCWTEASPILRQGARSLKQDEHERNPEFQGQHRSAPS
jgi:hypothetical protein